MPSVSNHRKLDALLYKTHSEGNLKKKKGGGGVGNVDRSSGWYDSSDNYEI